MNTFLAILAYGLLIVSSFFLAFMWGRVGIRQVRRTHDTCWQARKDPYAVIAASLLLSSIGTGIFFAFRTYQTMELRVSTVTPTGFVSTCILIGLYIMVVSKAGFVWAIHCSYRSKMWLFFLTTCMVWLGIALFWIDGL